MCERSFVVHLVLCGFSFHISLFPTVATGTTGAAQSSARDLEKLEWFKQAETTADSLHLDDIYYLNVQVIVQLITYKDPVLMPHTMFRATFFLHDTILSIFIPPKLLRLLSMTAPQQHVKTDNYTKLKSCE